jgi:hypothetical protein
VVNSVKGRREVEESQKGSIATIDGVEEVRKNFGDGRLIREASTKARL